MNSFPGQSTKGEVRNGASADPIMEGRSEGQGKEPWYVASTHVDRTFFIVDLSRLQQESDTLEGAMVVYRPQEDFKKVLIKSREVYAFRIIPRHTDIWGNQVT